jgi:hypothetical protein
MALGDFKHARGPVTVQKFLVKAGTAESIEAGEPVVQGVGGDVEYVNTMAVNITTGDTFVGIACSTSTDTATADGYVYVLVPSAGTVFRGTAHTKANLAAALRLTKVVLNYAAAGWTVDEDLTTNGLAQIVDYDATEGTVDFLIDMSEFLNA